MLAGKQSWIFDSKPVITATGTVGGPFEANGAIPEAFDLLHDDLWIGEDSYEKAQTVLIEGAVTETLKKASLKKKTSTLCLLAIWLISLRLPVLPAVPLAFRI